MSSVFRQNQDLLYFLSVQKHEIQTLCANPPPMICQRRTPTPQRSTAGACSAEHRKALCSLARAAIPLLCRNSHAGAAPLALMQPRDAGKVTLQAPMSLSACSSCPSPCTRHTATYTSKKTSPSQVPIFELHI